MDDITAISIQKILQLNKWCTPVLRLTLQVTDVLPARIRACVARPGLAKCGGAKPHKGRWPDWHFVEPEPPIGGEQLPFVRRRYNSLILIFSFFPLGTIFL